MYANKVRFMDRVQVESTLYINVRALSYVTKPYNGLAKFIDYKWY